MITPRRIKNVLLDAITFLEASACLLPPERFPHSHYRSNVRYPALVALQRAALFRLCTEPEKERALLLANLVTQIAIDKQTPTLLITFGCPPFVFAIILLLWRAGIDLEKAVYPSWEGNEFAILKIAAGELAGSPLHVVGGMSFAKLEKVAHQAIINLGIDWIIIDSCDSESLPSMRKLSCDLGVPVTTTAHI